MLRRIGHPVNHGVRSLRVSLAPPDGEVSVPRQDVRWLILICQTRVR